MLLRRGSSSSPSGWGVKSLGLTWVFDDHFFFVGIEVEWPSVRLLRADVAIGGYLETPFVSSSPLAPVPAEARDDRHV